MLECAVCSSIALLIVTYFIKIKSKRIYNFLTKKKKIHEFFYLNLFMYVYIILQQSNGYKLQISEILNIKICNNKHSISYCRSNFYYFSNYLIVIELTILRGRILIVRASMLSFKSQKKKNEIL